MVKNQNWFIYVIVYIKSDDIYKQIAEMLTLKLNLIVQTMNWIDDYEKEPIKK